MQVLATLHVQPKPEATKPVYILSPIYRIGARLVLHGMSRAGGLTLTGDAGAKLVLNLVEGSVFVCVYLGGIDSCLGLCLVI